MKKNDESQILKFIKYTPPIFIIVVSIIVTLIISLDYKKTLNIEKKSIRNAYIKDEKERIKKDVEAIKFFIQSEYNKTDKKLKKSLTLNITNAYNVVNSLYKNNKDLKTKEEVTKIIKDALKDIRYNNQRGYFFIYNLDGTNIFHPIYPNREGKNFFDEKDMKGLFRNKESIDIAKKNGIGFVKWHFRKPTSDLKEYEKLGIVKKFEPYNWFIGTGEYVDEFEKEVQESVKSYIVSFKPHKNRDIYITKKDEIILPSKLKSYIDKRQLITQINSKQNPKEAYQQIETIKGSKIIYTTKFDKWNWAISTGFFIKDIESVIDEKRDYLDKKYSGYMNTIIITSIVFTILLLVISLYISSNIEKKFIKYRKKLKNEVSENIKQKNILKRAQEVAHIGDWELDLKTMRANWSEEIKKILGLDTLPYNQGPQFLKKIMDEKDWEVFENSISTCIETGQEHQATYRIARPNGEIRWINCKGQLNEDTNSIIGIIQDVTENKRLEDEKLEKEELLYQQSKMAAMGEMLGNIAHQWRQPLSTISTASTGIKIQKEMDILTDKCLISSMEAINNSVQYLSQTIEDFRNFYKPNNEFEKFKVNEVVEKTLNLISAQFSAKEINIIKNIENVQIESIENELIQVLINILNNARDILITKENQKRFIFIKVYERDSSVFIEILDNGGGIEQKILDRIFEPYFTTKHKSQGTGIGLYMSEEIIIKHLNGQILAKNKNFSHEGIRYDGAKFKIILNKDKKSSLNT